MDSPRLVIDSPGLLMDPPPYKRRLRDIFRRKKERRDELPTYAQATSTIWRRIKRLLERTLPVVLLVLVVSAVVVLVVVIVVIVV